MQNNDSNINSCAKAEYCFCDSSLDDDQNVEEPSIVPACCGNVDCVCDSSIDVGQNVHYSSEVTCVQEEIKQKLDAGLEAKPERFVECTSSEILLALNIDRRNKFDPVSEASLADTYVNDEVEKTLAIIKPDAMQFAHKIQDRIRREGFAILQKRKVHLTPEQASEFYQSLYGTELYPSLIMYMSSSPIIVLCLAGSRAINHWRDVMGPTIVREAELYWPKSIRAKYGRQNTVENAVHGSSDWKSAEKEIHFFFPEMTIEPVRSGNDANDYITTYLKGPLVQGLAELCRVKPFDPIAWLADWLIVNNPYKPKYPEYVARLST